MGWTWNRIYNMTHSDLNWLFSSPTWPALLPDVYTFWLLLLSLCPTQMNIFEAIGDVFYAPNFIINVGISLKSFVTII